MCYARAVLLDEELPEKSESKGLDSGVTSNLVVTGPLLLTTAKWFLVALIYL